MKPKFQRSRLLALPLMITLAGAHAQAASSISLNFNSGAGTVTTAAKISGALPIAGNLWNNISGGSSSVGSLKDNTGTATTAGVTWAVSSIWQSASGGATATSENGNLTRGYLDDGGSGWSATITNNPYLLSNIYLIHGTDQTQGTAVMSAVSVNGTFYKGNGAGGTVLASGISDSWAAASFSTADTLIESTNYLKVLNQGAVALAGFSSSPGRSALAGLQIENAYTGTLAYWDISGTTAGAGGTTPSGNWADANWSTDPSGTVATGAWSAGNAAVFAAGADATGAYTVTLAETQSADAIWAQENAALTFTGGTLNLGSTGLLRADGTSSIVMASVLTGTDVKTSGVITLSNTNSYTGATGVSSGSLTVTGGSAIPNSSAVTLGGTLILGASETIGTLSGSGNITLAANTLTLGGATSTAYAGVISGSGGLAKQGAGTQGLSSQSTYTGGTTVNGGILDLTAGGGAAGSIRGTATVNTGGTLRLSTGDATGYAGGASSLSTINLSGGTLNVNTISNQTLGSATINMTAGSITGITGSNLDFFNGGSALNTLASATSSTISLPTLNLRQDNTVFNIADGDAANDLLISATIGNGAQGLHAMTKTGAGTMKLTALNIFTGNTTINAGVLDLTAGGLYASGYNGSAVVTVNTGGTLKLNSFGYSATASLGQLSAYGARRVLNGGTMEVTSGAESVGNNFNASTNGGVFRYHPADPASTLTLEGSPNSNIAIAGALILQADGTIVIGETIEGAGSLTKTGAQSLTLSGVSTYTGSTSINSGGLTISGSGQLGGGSYAGAITNAGTLAFNSEANQTLSGIISGAGPLSKSSAGRLTLSGVNTYTGTTSVSGGTLAVDGELAAASPVTVTAGGTLQGTGIVHGDITVADGGAVTGGNGTTGTLAVGSLTLDSAATISIGTLDNYTDVAALESYGNFTTIGGSGSITLNLPTATAVEGTYHLISSANTLPDTAAFVLGTAPALGSRQTGSLVIHGGFVDYAVSGINPSWTGALSGEWTSSALAWPKNWITNVGTDFMDGDVVTFDDTASGTTAITLDSTVAPASVFFANSSLDYSVSGTGSIAGATTTLIKSGPASLTLNTANTYGGGTVLDGGSLILGNAAALSDGPLALVNGSLGGTGTISGAVSGGALALNSAAGTITLSGVNTFTGATTIAAGTLAIGGAGQLGSGSYAAAITDNGSLAYNSSATQTLGGVISGSGSLVKNGAGTLTLAASESFAGAVQVDGGTLELSSPDYIRAFSPTTSITVNAGATLVINSVNVLQGQTTVFTPVTVNGGTITLNAYHNHFGPLTLNGGTINGIYAGGYDGQYSTIDYGVTVGGSATSTLTGTGASGYSVNSGNPFAVAATGDPSGNDLVVAAPLLGSSPLVKNGTGKMLLTAVNTLTGATMINEGTVETSGAGQLGSGTYAAAIAIANSATLAINSTANQTLAGVISGNGTLIKGNSGLLTLTGANTCTGNTVVNAGTLTLASGAQLAFAIGATSGTTNSISGAGTLVIDGNFAIDTTAAAALTSGTWTLENVASLSGAYGATFTVVGFVDAGSDKWTKTEGAKVWTFDEATGVLTLASSATFTSWMDSFTFAPGANTTPTGDPDGDGLSNAAEMVLGGNPASGMDAALAPTLERVTTDLGAGSVDYILFTFRRSNLSVAAAVSSNVQFGSDLSGWTTAVDGEAGVKILVDADFSFVPASPDTARVRVYIPRGTNTKLFARLDIAVP